MTDGAGTAWLQIVGLDSVEIGDCLAIQIHPPCWVQPMAASLALDKTESVPSADLVLESAVDLRIVGDLLGSVADILRAAGFKAVRAQIAYANGPQRNAPVPLWLHDWSLEAPSREVSVVRVPFQDKLVVKRALISAQDEVCWLDAIDIKCSLSRMNTVDLGLAQNLLCRGMVVDHRGRPLSEANAHIALQPAGGGRTSYRRLPVGGDGSFATFIPNEFVANAYAKYQGLVSPAISLVPSVPIVLTVDTGSAVWLRVHDRGVDVGRWVVGRRPHAWAGRSRVPVPECWEGGRWLVRDMGCEQYFLCWAVGQRQYESLVAIPLLAGMQTADIDVSSVHAMELASVVVEFDTEPCVVEFVSEQGRGTCRPLKTAIGANQSGELFGFPQGRYEVCIVRGGYDSEQRVSRQVEIAGGRNVVRVSDIECAGK